MSRTTADGYGKVFRVVTDTLQSALTQIDLPFDLRTPKKKLALIGLCAYQINSAGKSVNSILALPCQKRSHSVCKRSGTVSAIIENTTLTTKLDVSRPTTPSANTYRILVMYSASITCQSSSAVVGTSSTLSVKPVLFGKESEAFARGGGCYF